MATITTKDGKCIITDGKDQVETKYFNKNNNPQPIFTISNKLYKIYPKVVEKFKEVIFDKKNFVGRTLAPKYVDSQCWIPKIGHERSDGYITLMTSMGNFMVRGQMHIISYFCVHGLIPKDRPLITHQCAQRLCFNPDHLEAGTDETNIRDASNQHDIVKADAKSWKLTSDNAALIRFLHQRKILSIKQLSRAFDVHVTTIHQIVSGKSYADVDFSWLEGRQNIHYNFSPGQIKVMKDSQLPYIFLGKLFECSPTTIKTAIINYGQK